MVTILTLLLLWIPIIGFLSGSMNVKTEMKGAGFKFILCTVLLAMVVGLEAGAQPSSKPSDRAILNSNLLFAARAGDAGLVRTLVGQGAEPNTKDALGWPALVLAAANGHKEVVRFLLDQNVRADEPGRGDWTALMEAAGHGHLDTAKVLVERGAKLQEHNNWARSAYEIALDRNFTNVSVYLEQMGAKRNPPPPMLQAAYWGQVEELQEMLEANGGKNATPDNLGQLLHTAVQYGHIKVAELLLAREADINYPDPNPRTTFQLGRTPLMTVLENPRFPEMVKFLISKRADVNKADERGVTPLELAERISDVALRKSIVDQLESAGVRRKPPPKQH